VDFSKVRFSSFSAHLTDDVELTFEKPSLVDVPSLYAYMKEFKDVLPTQQKGLELLTFLVREHERTFTRAVDDQKDIKTFGRAIQVFVKLKDER
jgi:hypothetical protein